MGPAPPLRPQPSYRNYHVDSADAQRPGRIFYDHGARIERAAGRRMSLNPLAQCWCQRLVLGS
jgi:hypothetical protein